MYFSALNSYQGNMNSSYYPNSYSDYHGNSSSEKTITVEGNGIVKLEPDIVVINLGVETMGNEVSAAQAENARLSTAVVQAIKQMGVDEKDIKTSNYSIAPEYDYVEGNRVFRGYRVTHIYSITVRNIASVGQIIDIAVRNGANRVDSINFTVANPSPYINKALSLAVKDAFEKAQTISKTLGVEVNRIPNSIVEEYTSRPEKSTPGAMYLAAPTTPIESGQLEINSRIKAVFSLITR
jgi:uncharacterized protein